MTGNSAIDSVTDMLKGICEDFLDYMYNISQEKLQISASLALLFAIVVLADRGISLPNEVFNALLGVAVYTAVETIIYRFIKKSTKEPLAKVASVILALVITVLSASITPELEALLMMALGGLLYGISGYRSLISEEDSPAKKYKENDYIGAFAATLSYILGLLVISVAIFVIVISVMVLIVN